MTSEVGRLRRALVHEPGSEVDRMTPGMMRDLLFDDILHGDGARDEHRRFRRVLQHLGVEVLEAMDLLSKALATDEGRRWLETSILPQLEPRIRDAMSRMAADRLARVIVRGARRRGRDPGGTMEELFDVPPLPNWCFQRDTQVVLGRAVLFSAMRNRARQREALLSRAIFRFHPDFSSTPVLPELAAHAEAAKGDRPSAGGSDTVLEGGDVLVLSPEVIAVGHSERTTDEGIEALARALSNRPEGPRWLIRVDLPRERAFMHLDAVFTPVGREACLVFPPVMLPGSPRAASTWEYDLHAADPRPVARGPLLEALAARGISYEPIPCGGLDPIDQEREQWTDGANALALAPDVVVLYDRNVRTAEEMDRRGYQVVRADELLLGAVDLSLERPAKSCILTPSGELSRARGGPHCLVHPLRRDAA